MGEHPTGALALHGSEAILAVVDVVATARFYREVLGFESQWVWGEPPTFGGVRWGRVHIMLCLQPEVARAVEGHMHAFFCDDVDALRERHRRAGAPVVSEIENKPWGIREYTVRDPNGYHLRFGGPPTYQRGGARPPPPAFVRIVERMPSVEELGALAASVGWQGEDGVAAAALRNSLYGVVAEDTRGPAPARTVGALRVVGDGARFFYIQDVMVRPELQRQGIGSAMMEAVMAWLKRAAPKGAFVGLFTGLPGFYDRYGFRRSGGMCLTM